MAEGDNSAAIHIIKNIVDKVLSQTKMAKIVSAIQQIIALYKYIPDDLRKKVFIVFSKLWNRQTVLFSTKKNITELFFKSDFEDAHFRKLYLAISPNDASALHLGYIMRELISRWQHVQSDEVKISVHTKFGPRGLTIVNMITTNDILLLYDEIAEINTRHEIKQKLDWWIDNYKNIGLLISPEKVSDSMIIEKLICSAAREPTKKYIIINMISNDLSTIEKLTSIIEGMKEKKLLNYSIFEKQISESGLYHSFKGTIHFD